MTKKQVFRCIAFVLVVCMMLVALCDLLELNNTSNYDKRYTTFRKLEKNTVDAVYLGTSGVDRYWISPKAYEEYGMTVYPLAIDSMPTWLYVEVLEDVFKRQNPELILIDARSFGQDNVSKTVMDTRARRVLDAMSMFSVSRIKAGFKTMKVMHSTFEDEQPRIDLSYLFSFVKYHDKWKDDDYKIKNNLGNKEHLYGGFYITGNSTTIEPMEPTPYKFDIYEPLDPVAEESLYELLDFLEEKDVDVLFVDTPQLKDDKEIGRGNTLYKILDEKGIDYVHFLNTDPASDALHVIDFDYNHDFYDAPHVNYYGAEKFTDYFAKYLNDNYDLADHRDEEDVAKDWDGKYEAVVKKIKADEKKKNNK